MNLNQLNFITFVNFITCTKRFPDRAVYLCNIAMMHIHLYNRRYAHSEKLMYATYLLLVDKTRSQCLSKNSHRRNVAQIGFYR